jgi:predicted acyltransferase
VLVPWREHPARQGRGGHGHACAGRRPARENEKAVKAGSNRLVSLDAFRGITIAGMILVNNPGNWNAVFQPLVHADWNG